jgi:hypothetical protein
MGVYGMGPGEEAHNSIICLDVCALAEELVDEPYLTVIGSPMEAGRAILRGEEGKGGGAEEGLGRGWVREKGGWCEDEGKDAWARVGCERRAREVGAEGVVRGNEDERGCC